MLIAILLTSMATAQTNQAPAGQETERVPRVALELVADRTRIVAGESFELGARYVIPPGCHIYWENPGDSGMKTQATLVAPDAFKVEGPLYPGPERFDLPGDIVSYGYAKETMLLFRVTPPKELDAGAKYTFELRSRWLVCHDACFLGEGEKRLVLQTADPAHPSQRSNQKLFETQRRMLPRAWKELRGVAWDWSHGSGPTRILAIKVAEADRLEFFPAPDSELECRARVLGVDRDWAVITLKVSDRKKPISLAPSLRGILRVERDRATTWYEVDMPRPPDEPKR